MTAEHTVIIIGGSILLMAAMIIWMKRANEAERRSMERRRQEWIDAGRIPEEKPIFYAGPGNYIPLDSHRLYSNGYPYDDR